MRLHNNQKIVFFGDSITRGHFGNNYIRILGRMLEDRSVKGSFQFINAGRDGDMVEDLIDRVWADVLPKKPDWVVVLIGINDLFFESIYMFNPTQSGGNGSESTYSRFSERFKTTYSRLVYILKEEVENIALCTLTGIEGDENPEIQDRLAIVNDIIRALAREQGCYLIDVSNFFRIKQHTLRTAGHRKEFVMTIDGVHLSPFGAEAVAEAMYDFFTSS